MSANDVQINIIGRDQATSAFQSVLSSAEKTSKGVESLGSGVGTLNSSFTSAGSSANLLSNILGNTAGYAMAIAGVNGLGDALHTTIGAAVEFYTTMQTGSISLAGSLMSMGQLNGQDLTWNQSLIMSKKLMMELSDQALVTGASTKEISDVFRAMVPNSLSAGMNLEQTLKLAGTLTTAGKAMGLNGSVLMRDVQDLISGKNVQRTKLGALLGLTNQDIEQAKQSAGGLFDFLTKRLQGEIEANQQYLESFEGRWNHLKESIARAGGMGMDALMKSATSEMADIANQIVKVNNETHQIEYVNPDVINGIATAGQVFMNFGGQLREFGNDIKGVAVPALQGLAAGIDFTSQHAAMMSETLIGLWVARRLNTYVLDYRNALNGASEAQTFLGRAALQTKAQIDAQTAAVAAQKAAFLAQSRESMASIATTVTPKYGNTKNIAEEIALEAQLGQRMTETATAETSKIVAANTAKMAFQGANAALMAGETELAVKILETNAQIEARGIASGTMAARTASAIELIKMGEIDLAQKVLATNAALDWQSTSGLITGANVAEGAAAGKMAQAELAAATSGSSIAMSEAGIAGATMGGKIETAGKVAGTAVKNLGTAVWALAGGWVGVAIAIGAATIALVEHVSKLKQYNEEHTFKGPDGKYYTYTQEGEVVSALSPDADPFTNQSIWGPGYSGMGYGANEGPSEETKQDIIAQENAKEAAEKQAETEKEIADSIRKQEEYQKTLKAMSNDPKYSDMKGTIDDMIKSITGKYGDSGAAAEAQKTAEKLANEQARIAQQMAEANHQYSETIQRNAQLIQQANEKIAGILASENEKLLAYSGTQYQQDMAKAVKNWEDTRRQINGAAVNLKTLSFTTAQHLAGGNSDWSILSGDFEGLTDGMKNAVSKILWKAKELGVPDATVTSGASGEHASNSWHYSGQGADVAWSGLNWSSPALQELALYAKSLGFAEVFSSKEEDPAATGPHLHLGGPSETAQSSSSTPSATANVQSAISGQIQSNQTQILAQTDEVKSILKAAQESNFDASLALAGAMRESGGDTLNGINMAPNGGMMQITEQSASDYGINAMYPDWQTDMEQNALAGIAILKKKIEEQGGDIWAGVKAYNGSGPSADEYLSKVEGNYNALGANGSINLAPTSFYRYAPPGTQQAFANNDVIKKNAEDKASLDLSIRRRKQIEETTQANDQLSTTPDASEKLIRDKAAAELAAVKDQFKELWQASGKDPNDRQTAIDLTAAKTKKILYQMNSDLRENLNTQQNLWQQHYINLGYFDNDYQQNIDKNQQRLLARTIATQKEELKNEQLTVADRIKLEQQYVENMKSLAAISGKYSFSAAWKNQTQEIKLYTMNAQSAMKDGWNNITGDMEGVFSNLLTSNQSFADRMRNMYINVANEILNTVMKIIMEGLIMSAIESSLGMLTYNGLSTSSWSSILSSSGITGMGTSIDTSLMGDSSWLNLTGAYASGGNMPSGYALVGEKGPEIIQTDTPSYVYNASQTADILGKIASNGNSGGSSVPSVSMTLVNQSGQQLQADTPKVSFDGEKYILSTVIKGLSKNQMGIRNVVKGMV